MIGGVPEFWAKFSGIGLVWVVLFVIWIVWFLILVQVCECCFTMLVSFWMVWCVFALVCLLVGLILLCVFEFGLGFDLVGISGLLCLVLITDSG